MALMDGVVLGSFAERSSVGDKKLVHQDLTDFRFQSLV